MKTLKLSTLSLLLTTLFFVNVTKAQDAPNINFTDLDGTTHDLYSYLDSGYTVILDFSFEYCGPCHLWSINVGHALWEDHGPDGDNTIRMFFFDIDPRTDEDILSYTQEWGVEYPVINLDSGGVIPEYPQPLGYPTIYYICSDKSYSETGGYGYPSSEVHADYLLAKCEGVEIPDSNVTFVAASLPLSSTICNASPLKYIPSLILTTNADVDGAPHMDQFYEIEVFVNDSLLSTQQIDPWSDYMVTDFDKPTLSPIEVNFNDEITMVVHYPSDTYAVDDTVRVTVPSEIFTPSSSDTTFVVEQNDIFFYVLNSEDTLVFDSGEENIANFSLPEDSCYSIVFYNTHLFSAKLTDGDGNIILSVEPGQFEGDHTPRLFFNVSDSAIVKPEDTTSISENSIREQLLSVSYFDLLGRQHFVSNKSNLPRGLYIEVKHYKSGLIESKKFYLD